MSEVNMIDVTKVRVRVRLTRTVLGEGVPGAEQLPVWSAGGTHEASAEFAAQLVRGGRAVYADPHTARLARAALAAARTGDYGPVRELVRQGATLQAPAASVSASAVHAAATVDAPARRGVFRRSR